MVWRTDARGMAACVYLNKGLTSGDSASLLIAKNVVVLLYLALSQSMLYLKLLSLKKKKLVLLGGKKISSFIQCVCSLT